MFKQLLAFINRKKSKVDFENSVKQYQSTKELQEENKKLQLENQLYLKKIKRKNKRIRELESSINNQKVQMNMNQEQVKVEQRYTSSTVLMEKINSPSEKKKAQKALNEKFENLKENNNLQGLKSENKPIRKLAFVTRLPLNHPLLTDTSKQLLKESIQLAVYSDPFFQSQSGYAVIQVLSDKQSGKTYILESEIGKLKKKLGAKWPDIRAYNEKAQVIKKIDMNTFAWPSTDLKGGNTADERSVFKDVSELKKLGYQITGMTREKRWKVLETAVIQLGLKKVAYTIAQNVKLRKGQKDGEKKFSFAIAEWEYDLNKMKQRYYRHDFSWPLTK